MVRRSFCAFALAGLTAASATAQPHISIRATSILSGDFLGYAGLGDVGGGVGHGTYQLGTCAYDGISRNFCVTTGNYVELAGSQNPGATGTFTWRMTWLGNIPNPIQAVSNAPGSNTLSLYNVPAGAFFEVLLGNGRYANLDFGAPDTPNPTGGALNWQAFLTASPVCTGSPSACTVASVGLTNGSTISSALGQFDMQLDYRTSVVPEPSSVAMMGVGLLAIAIHGYRRRSDNARV